MEKNSLPCDCKIILPPTAIAVNAVLSVIHPHICGIGGDVIFLFYSAAENKVFFLNGSGRSPCEASIEVMTDMGLRQIPKRGVLSVSVPGCVQGWGDLWKQFGKLPFKVLLQQAVCYAKQGFPVSSSLASYLEREKDVLRHEQMLRQCFLPYGRLVRIGHVITLEELAYTLERIGEEGPEVFYQGEIAEKIHQYMSKRKGLLTRRDLEMHTSTWSEPLVTTYRGYSVFQTPPNTQGLTTLMGLNILEGLNMEELGCDSPEYIHYLIETKKICYQYRDQYITDPDFVPIDCKDMLDKLFAGRLRKMIISGQALRQGAKGDCAGDSSCFAVADSNGNVISGAQGLYNPFGSGCLIDETGIILHNRGMCFSLDPGHINRLEPFKRTFHNLSASLILQKNKPVYAFGASGIENQTQVYLQVLSKMLDFGWNLQEAIDAPRWVHGAASLDENATYLNIEGRFPIEIAGILETWGHNVRLIDDWAEQTGEAQGIAIDQETGVYLGGADSRTEGYVSVW